MTSIIKIKRSEVAGHAPAPADLEVGELAVNFTDRKIYSKDSSNQVVDFMGTRYWKIWTGTDAEYQALGAYDAETLYVVTAPAVVNLVPTQGGTLGTAGMAFGGTERHGVPVTHSRDFSTWFPTAVAPITITMGQVYDAQKQPIATPAWLVLNQATHSFNGITVPVAGTWYAELNMVDANGQQGTAFVRIFVM